MTVQAWETHPVFSHVRSGSLEPLEHGDAREQWRHLSALVARDGHDLESHARRVLLAFRPPLTDLAFGALVDLFLALGERGRGLRRRLLETGEGWLEADEAHFLRMHLEPGLTRATALPAAPGSVFHNALVGVAQMVAHQRHAVAQMSPHAQAVSLLEDGDLAGASQLLEDALLADPSDAEVSHELLGIYRHSRNDAARAAMAERLQASHGRLPDGWA
ncbi:hypothetical protein Lcho_0654 [Leptothrix cholodnii SP-6]|uniref:Tetratricopeptide repeat protein n=1 Tax=Leptothrix cholodnii (strain ATCC 51168 / LMG 8142 / SP-6) TaxID=395495 RepID=B1XZT3_LEPCP|nr:hypothetical protein [Leptothrix cholodnii]ACB32929.1 hypothetical protein Lcho_0654 [Leptothrix cholodnii SP-6]